MVRRWQAELHLELSLLHILAEYWPYSFKMRPKIAISMNDTDYAK